MTVGARVAGRRRRGSLRSRMIVMTAVVVAAVVTAGGVVIAVAVRADLVESADEAALDWADDVAAQVEQDALPAVLPAIVEDEQAAVQVVSGERVLAATENLTDSPVLDLARPPVGQARVLGVDDLPLAEPGPYRVAARSVAGPASDVTVFVVISLEDLDELVASAASVGGVGLALLVLVLCGVMWVVIGRTLAPVDAITERAEVISGRHLDRRVPELPHDDEISRLARTVNAMLGRLQGSAERQRRFVADAAHELRNPIASLRAQLETAGDGAGQGRALVPGLMAETVRMQVLVDQLLLLARSDAGTLPANGHAVDLDDAVDAAVSSTPARPGVPVDLSALQPVQVPGDADLLEQAVRNLVENAVRHARSAVGVALSARGTHAELIVDDDGPGIAQQHREVVFRRFTRLDEARDRDEGGVGLGLSIVADIVSAHGGSIDVTDAPAGGARFTVRLPLDGGGKD